MKYYVAFVVLLILAVIVREFLKHREMQEELIGPNEAQELSRKFGLISMPSGTPAETLMTIFEMAHAAIISAQPISRTSEFVNFYDRLRRTIVAWAHEGSPFV